MTDEDKGQLVVEDYNPDTYARSSRVLPRAQIRATGDLCRSAMGSSGGACSAPQKSTREGHGRE